MATLEERRTLLADRLAVVETRIRQACVRANRERDEVTLIAVTKTVSPEVAQWAYELGQHDLGENRPQELWRKGAVLPAARWHFIGHMQRNKIDRTFPLVHLWHSVDSLRLLQALAKEGEAHGRPPNVLLQVNISSEGQKQGFAPEELPMLWPEVACLPVNLLGLMGMAAYADDPEEARPAFRLLRTLREQAPWPLPYLSMGMSGDYEVAIEEGATHIRLGTTLFNGLEDV